MVQKMAKKVLRKRSESIEQLAAQEFDVAIVGGGINGAVAAAALAGHGVKVALIEKEDFACGVSSQSSNLAWGGIKYMETFELGLVRKLCQSRNRLTALFPSAVREVRFLTVVRNNFRWPAFLLYLGSVLYWFLGSFKTRPPRYLSKKQIRRLEPVLEVSDASAGFEYSDCHFEDNDARFVFNMVRAARDSGAITANYVSAVQSERIGNRWQIDAQDEVSGRKFLVRAKVFINACGPYVDELNQRSNQKTEHRHLFSKGVHLIVKRVTEQRRVLTLFASDGRPFFVIPMGDRTCVGTTDTEVDDPEVGVTDEDRRFILDNVNAGLVLDPPLEISDIIAERCGVRPLAVRGKSAPEPETNSQPDEESGDWLQLSRKHALDIDTERAHISIFGGKLTDCLNVGDSIVEHVSELGVEVSEAAETANGYWCGEPDEAQRLSFMQAAQALELDSGLLASNRAFNESASDRLWRRYGADAFEVLKLVEEDPGQKEPALTCSPILRCELEYARRWEMVVTLDDFFRRRTRISQLSRKQQLITDPGIERLCEQLFAEDASVKLEDYVQVRPPAHIL